MRQFSTYLFVLCLLPLCLASSRADALQPALDKILAMPAMNGGITGAIVCRVSDRQVLYEHDADIRLLPASNRKLFTSAAALELLGDNFTLPTELVAAAKPDVSGALSGSLYLRGGGDGLFSSADLQTMVQTLQQAGVKRIAGDIVGDGTLFTDGPYGFGWEWDDFSDEEFPQISGLEINEGVLGVHLAAGASPGDPVTATLVPSTNYLAMVNAATTGVKEVADTSKVRRPWERNDFLVMGTLPLGKVHNRNVPVDDPPLYAATLLREALIRAGIAVSGRPITGKTPPEATVVLATHASQPLAQYLAKMNKPSDNLLAESLIRMVGVVKGKGGSYDAGHAVEMPFFQSLGVDTGQIQLVDGCGVGRRNFVTARAVSQLLLGMKSEPDWQVYYDSLPIAGVDGTLKTRMIGTPAAGNVHAKTGTLAQVRALSGYLTGKSGQLYVFSILMNNFPGTAHEAGLVQDAFVENVISSL